MAVKDDRQVRPPVAPAEDVRDIGSPALVALTGPADASLDAGTWGHESLVHEPPFEREDSVHGLRRDPLPLAESQPRPQPPVAERRVLLNQRLELGRERVV